MRFGREWKQVLQRMSGSLPHDEFLYLGGNEQSTHKYVSELLGKETIDTNTFGKSSGRSGNYSTNYQISGRELLTPDEVRMLDNQYAILFIRGELPVMDFKYDILKHPNVALTADGRGAPAGKSHFSMWGNKKNDTCVQDTAEYTHGNVTDAVATITIGDILFDDVENNDYFETTYELLSDEDFEVLQY